jgi:hypothetical protein
MRVCLLVIALSTGMLAAGCLFPSLDGLEEEGHRPDTTRGSVVGASVLDGGAQRPAAPSSTAAVTTAGAPTAAPPKDCEPQDVSWTGSGASSSCSGSSRDHLTAGMSRELSDVDAPLTGTVTVICIDGQLQLSKPVCELPTVIDVSGPKGCGSGYCGGVMAANCPHPDPAKAKAICVKRGFVDQVGFVTAPSTPGTRQCLADETTCGVSENSCNIIFTSVTCRR